MLSFPKFSYWHSLKSDWFCGLKRMLIYLFVHSNNAKLLIISKVHYSPTLGYFPKDFKNWDWLSILCIEKFQSKTIKFTYRQMPLTFMRRFPGNIGLDCVVWVNCLEGIVLVIVYLWFRLKFCPKVNLNFIMEGGNIWCRINRS